MAPTAAGRTDVGRVRTNNEDSLLIDDTLGLYIVADGMGGHSAGEVASRTACEVVQREIGGLTKPRARFEQSGKSGDLKALCRAVSAAMTTACKAIFKMAQKNPELAGMGCTCTLMWVLPHNKGILGHIGDSRLYVLRNRRIHQLSEDHSFVNELLKRGAITKAQAKNHPQGNVLSRAMGPQPSVPMDTMAFDIDAGDVYLLCSDGLTHYYPEPEEMAAELLAADQQAGVDALIDRALERGGHDNTTAISLRFAGAPLQDAAAAENRIALLKRIPIFAHLSYNELVRVVGLTSLKQIPASTLFIQEGQPGDELYVVLAGEVEVLKGDDRLAELGAGVHLGEMAMVDSAPRSASVRALSDVTLLVMGRTEFFGLIRAEPVIASKLLWSFVQVLSTRLRDTNEALRGARDPGEDAFEVFLDDDDDDDDN